MRVGGKKLMFIADFKRIRRNLPYIGSITITRPEGCDMNLFRKRDVPLLPYDRETMEPAVRSSICTGEMTVGFLDRKTGRFREYELARGQSDVKAFCKRVGMEPKDIKRIY